MMRRQLATAIVNANPPQHALRPFLLALLVMVAGCALAASSTAHACAMYIPPEVEHALVAQADSPTPAADSPAADSLAADSPAEVQPAGPSLADIFAVIDGEPALAPAAPAAPTADAAAVATPAPPAVLPTPII